MKVRDDDWKRQFDNRHRIVSLANLDAMCKRAGGVMCHSYKMDDPTATRVRVWYSNEDEWAGAHPICADFPLVPIFGGVGVLMEFVYVSKGKGDGSWHGEEWQAFTPLMDCPELFRVSSDSDVWETREAIEARMAPKTEGGA